MCLILFAYHYHPEYPLIVAANRDEFYSRPTQAAHWWPETPQILAGKDLEAGGTWMGVNLKGRFAAITNIREPQVKTAASNSRGLIPQRFLSGTDSLDRFSAKLAVTRSKYNGYNLLFGDHEQIYYFSNRGKMQNLQPGLYGLSNAQLDTAWPKITLGKRHLQEKMKQNKLTTDELMPVLSSDKIAADEQLPDTGVNLEWERLLSSIRIRGNDYGTRSSTILLIDKQRQVRYHEKQLGAKKETETKYSFVLSHDTPQS